VFHERQSPLAAILRLRGAIKTLRVKLRNSDGTGWHSAGKHETHSIAMHCSDALNVSDPRKKQPPFLARINPILHSSQGMLEREARCWFSQPGSGKATDHPCLFNFKHQPIIVFQWCNMLAIPWLLCNASYLLVLVEKAEKSTRSLKMFAQASHFDPMFLIQKTELRDRVKLGIPMFWSCCQLLVAATQA